MRWRLKTQVYLPLVLLFWLVGSAGSFAVGAGLRQTPEGLNGVTAYMSQGFESLLASMFGTNAHAAQSEVGPSVSTVVTAPPTSTTPPPPAPHTAAPAPPTKVNQGDDGNDQNKGPNGHGKNHKGKGDSGNDDSGDSDG